MSHILSITAPQAPAGAVLRDLDIGVIYTHERHYMGPLMETMSASGDGLDMRLILVDNAADDVQPWLRYFPDHTVVRNEERLGYAPNLNRILAVSDARYVLLMNTDMSFEPDEQCLAKMVAFMDEHTDCGLSICRLYHPGGEYGFPARKFQTPSTIAARRLPLGRLFAGDVRQYLYRHRSQYETFDCDWVLGCFLMLRKEAVADVGLFDCQFRKYFEDVDYSLRMQQAGWSVMFNGATFAYHYYQRASTRLLGRDAWTHLQSYGRWLRKWGLSAHAAQQHSVSYISSLKPATPSGSRVK